MGAATLDPGSSERPLDLCREPMVGDYRIDHTIGVGGMAAVYQATQPVIGKRVAIKVLHRTRERHRASAGSSRKRARST